MMKRSLVWIVTIALLLVASQAFGQYARKNQVELYAGAAFPMGPEEFKDYHKIGLSLNGQYVFFPSPKLGIPIFVGYEYFSTDAGAVEDLFVSTLRDELLFYDVDLVSANVDVEGSASAIKFGLGVRPYLTQPEASTQFFLFGQGTYNMLRQNLKFKGGSVTATDRTSGMTETISFTASDLGAAAESKTDDSKFGLAGGAGFEIPFGETMNIIIQGLFHVIFTEDESTTFIGATAGLVF